MKKVLDGRIAAKAVVKDFFLSLIFLELAGEKIPKPTVAIPPAEKGGKKP